MKPPIADKIPVLLKSHNDERIDNYYWLNERDNPKVLNHLIAENAYFESQTKHTEAFQESLFQEMKSRIKEDDESLPYKKNGYHYITKYSKGRQHPEYYRRKDQTESVEELLLDVNQMVKNHKYYKVRSLSISPDNRYMAFAVDIKGHKLYTIYIKDLNSGKLLKDRIKNTSGSTVWANDNATLFYCKKEAQTLRVHQVLRHELHTDVKQDVLVYEEQDNTFDVFVSKTKSEVYLLMGCGSSTTSEYQFLDANTPTKPFKVFQKRRQGLEYSIEHYQESFYILTNLDKAKNFKIMKTPVDKTLKKYWQNLIEHRSDVLLEDFSVFKDFMVIEERSEGLLQIRIKSWDDSLDYYLPFSEETYTTYVPYNPEFDTKILRYGYQSLTTPNIVFDFDVFTQEKSVVKAQEVLGGQFKSENYKSERIFVTARDGKKVAVSLVYRKDTNITKNTPLLLYAYGAYGITIDDSFSTVRLSLLDRGFIFGIAHVRGGEYLGRAWYDDGRLFHKKNTFNDFIDVAKYLIASKYTSPQHLYAEGGSAGGLLMGVVVNTNPELFNGVIAAVPFVDALTTMEDESLPLTTGEYDEWGNPEMKRYFYYIKSYSPYDNISAKKYPNILVTTGLYDSQVQYFEPAKWVAKLREFNVGDNKILFQINLDVGHGGASGRFESLKEIARDYSFLLDLENIGC